MEDVSKGNLNMRYEDKTKEQLIHELLELRGRIVEMEAIVGGHKGTGDTDRKSAEKTPEGSEEKYRLIADNISDVIWTMDTNLKFTYASPSVEKLRGYSAEEAMNQTLEETLTPASLGVAMNAFKKEAAKEKVKQGNLMGSRTLELELICKDGPTVWTDSKMTFLRDSDGRIVEVLGVTRNINERKQAERALKESEEKYRTLVETLNDLVFTLDVNGRFTYLSPELENC